MSADTVAILGFVALFALMLLRVPVGMRLGRLQAIGSLLDRISQTASSTVAAP